MKRFRVERESGTTIVVTLWKPPYEDENILNKTGWKAKDVTITEMKTKFEDEE
tara:strand:+ start:361 stop:519 length:159 start_codon:yes stop_codon:yes gene_type:complete